MTWTPTNENQLKFVEHSCWPDCGREGQEARRIYPHRPPMTIHTGEDLRNGYSADNIEDHINKGTLADEFHEMFATKFLYALGYDYDEISKLKIKVAREYIERGGGFDAIVLICEQSFEEGEQLSTVCCEFAIDFALRLREVIGSRYCGGVWADLEMLPETEAYIIQMARGGLTGERVPGYKRYWYRKLGEALWGQKRFGQMSFRFFKGHTVDSKELYEIILMRISGYGSSLHFQHGPTGQ